MIEAGADEVADGSVFVAGRNHEGVENHRGALTTHRKLFCWSIGASGELPNSVTMPNVRMAKKCSSSGRVVISALICFVGDSAIFLIGIICPIANIIV